MGLLRSGGNQPTQVTIYSGLQIQTTSSAVPVPIVYGRNLVAPNVIWYNNFRAWARRSGGKGSKTYTYTYYADIIMGVCEGPISQIGSVWQSSPIPTNLGLLGLSFF